MTNADLIAFGEKFLEQRRGIIKMNSTNSSPEVVADLLRDWEFVDPLRIAIYAHAKSTEGPWAIDMNHVRSVCVNTAAFIQPKPSESLRAGDMSSAE